jgi:hypothetical protein
MLLPDGTPTPGSPFHTGGDLGVLAVVIDGNDQVWSSNFAGASITHLCGRAPRPVHRGWEGCCRSHARSSGWIAAVAHAVSCAFFAALAVKGILSSRTTSVGWIRNARAGFAGFAAFFSRLMTANGSKNGT